MTLPEPPPPLDPDALYPHYTSTYCIHRDCVDCRLTCKTCNALCQCRCHWGLGLAR
jgi:hypothetical protein